MNGSHPSATVYVDESYSFQDGNFVLAAVVVPHPLRAPLLDAWTDLQRRITAALVQDYPLAQAYFAAHPERLAEIHAVRLFQSTGYYQKYRRSERQTEPYYLQHYRWLHEAFELQRRFELPIVALEIADMAQVHPARRGLPTLAEAIRASWDPASGVPLGALSAMFAEMDRLEHKPFTFALPRLVTLLERVLAERGVVAEVVCDDDDEHNRFSTFSIFERLQAAGNYPHLRKPVFESSEQNAFLQIADIVAYVLRRRAADARRGVASKPEIAAWAELLGPQLVALPYLGARDEAHHYAMMAEYLLRNSGGPHAVREALLRHVSDLVLALAEHL